MRTKKKGVYICVLVCCTGVQKAVRLFAISPRESSIKDDRETTVTDELTFTTLMVYLLGYSYIRVGV